MLGLRVAYSSRTGVTMKRSAFALIAGSGLSRARIPVEGRSTDANPALCGGGRHAGRPSGRVIHAAGPDIWLS